MSGSSPGPGASNHGLPVGLARGCVACVGSDFIQNDGKWRPRAHYEPWGGALVPHATAARKRRSNARRNTALTAKDLEPQRRRFVSDRFRGSPRMRLRVPKGRVPRPVGTTPPNPGRHSRARPRTQVSACLVLGACRTPGTAMCSPAHLSARASRRQNDFQSHTRAATSMSH